MSQIPEFASGISNSGTSGIPRDSTYPSWSNSRGNYRRREPEQTNLYRLIYHYRDEFERRYEELFQQEYGELRSVVLETFDAYLTCGILRHGCALACCENCSRSILLAYSCKRRGVCPSCQAKRAVLFAENLHENVLLPHDHRHLVFSIPKRLRFFFRRNRNLYSLLYQAAWQAWSEYVSGCFAYGSPGAVMALHAAGNNLNFNPHLHVIALNGVVLDDGHFLSLPQIDPALVEEYFAENVFLFLLEQELIDQDTVIAMKSWPHSGFQVYAGRPIAAEDKDARLFLARYLKKAPLCLSRLRLEEGGPNQQPVVVYLSQEKETGESSLFPEHFAPEDESTEGHGGTSQLRNKEKSDQGAPSQQTFTPLEFLAQLSLFVPNLFEQTTRFFGAYSNRTRGKKNREARFAELAQNNFQPLEPPEEHKSPSANWARLIKLIFEVDPLQCQKCGSAMKIKSFIQDPDEISRITKHLGLSWRAPPPLGVNYPDQPYYDYSEEYLQ